jgi:hypothetical protein
VTSSKRCSGHGIRLRVDDSDSTHFKLNFKLNADVTSDMFYRKKAASVTDSPCTVTGPGLSLFGT